MTNLDHKANLELCEKASKNWFPHTYPDGEIMPDGSGGIDDPAYDDGRSIDGKDGIVAEWFASRADRDFCIAARSDWPQYIQRVQELEAIIKPFADRYFDRIKLAESARNEGLLYYAQMLEHDESLSESIDSFRAAYEAVYGEIGGDHEAKDRG